MADIRIKDLATTATTTASDDFMAVDGATNGTRKLSANAPSFLGNITSGGVIADQGGTIAAQRNGLAPAQGLAFDGTTAATVAVPAITDGTVAFWINAPTYSGSNPFPVLGAIGSYSTIYVNTSGAIQNEGLSQSSSLLPAGVWSFGAVTKSGTTVTYYVNGIAAGSQTQAQPWNASTKIGLLSGQPFPATLRPPIVFNRALSAAEVLALYQSGAVASADYNTASNTNAGSTWANTGTGYSSFTSGSATGFTATATGLSYAGNNIVQAQKVGARWLVKFNISVASGSGPANLISWNGGGFGSTVAGNQAVASGDNSIVITGTANQSTNWLLTFQSLAAGTFTVSGFSITPLGALLAPDANNAGAGLEWLDVSGNRAHIVLPTSGVTWSLPSSQQIVIEASTATNGNQQLGGASLIDANKQWRIQSWTVNCSTGTPTISLGNVSAGTQYVSGAVMAAGNNDITLLARFPSTANLWVNSSTTATLIHRITLVPAN